jgi:hypothetical protein
MNETFRNVYGKDASVLCFALKEKEWNGRNKEAQIAASRAASTNQCCGAIGNRIPLNNFDQWLKELDRITNHVNVHRVHLKFMVVDPLSDRPVVVTGSANFSEASTRTNDENMLVIEDNSAARSRAHHRAPRGLARESPLSEHGSIEGAQKAGDAPSGLTMLRPTKGCTPPTLRRRRSPRCALGKRATAAPRGMASPDPMIDFAELDAHNYAELLP